MTTVLDSRRLTGQSLLLDGPGAILEAALPDSDIAAAIARWESRARRMAGALGWAGGTYAHRVHPGGAQVAFTAPIDLLYLATEVNEWAWAAAEAAGDAPSFEARRDEFAARAQAERDPALLALAAAALDRGLTFLSDDRRASVGLGAGARSWPRSRLPAAPDRVRWNGLHDVPVALVTGTNGKTTTVRLLGAIARAAGRVAGITSTDRVDVGDQVVAVGDYSGPNGARTVLRDRRVELAFLEVARGGILRRGLPVPRADAALVTNVANDHLGEYGIHDLETLADAKLVVAKAVGSAGRVVLNADDPRLLARGRALGNTAAWFTLDARHPDVAAHLAAGGDACVLEDGVLVALHGAERHAIARVDEVPITHGGAALHNVANALGAIGVARALGLPIDAIRAGLTGFDNSAAANPGRTNRWEVDGFQVIVDFAHNPHGLAALASMARAIPARRRALVIGQAGDRDDGSIAELARVAATMEPDRVFIKEMAKYLRGREPGVVPALIERELRGAGRAEISHHASELAAVQAALAWARPGDLLVLTVHTDRDAVTALLRERKAEPAGDARHGGQASSTA